MIAHYTKVACFLGRFPKVRTGRPDHGRTRYFGNELAFFPIVFAEKTNNNTTTTTNNNNRIDGSVLFASNMEPYANSFSAIGHLYARESNLQSWTK